MGNKQDNFQLHRFTVSKNTTKSFVGEGANFLPPTVDSITECDVSRIVKLLAAGLRSVGLSRVIAAIEISDQLCLTEYQYSFNGDLWHNGLI